MLLEPPGVLGNDYELRPGQYRLWGFRPTSIRDQINRAQLLASQLDIGFRQRIGVFGAGAAGVACAGALSFYRHDVVLFEERHAFCVQAGVHTRWLDPHEYDWPKHYWMHPHFPFDIAIDEVALHYTSGWASEIYASLSFQLQDYLSEHKFRFFSNATDLVVGYNADFSRFTVSCSYGGAQEHFEDEFDIIIDASGIREETPSFQTFTGIRYWENDDLLELAPEARVLVVGGGDGALQDAIRAYTGLPSFREVINLLPRSLYGGLVDRLLHSDDDLSRQLALCKTHPRVERSRLYKESLREHHRLVKQCASEVALELPAELRAELKFESRGVSLTIAHRGDFVGPAFTGNIFLAELLEHLDSSRFKRIGQTSLKSLVQQSDGSYHVRLEHPGVSRFDPGAAYDRVVPRFGRASGRPDIVGQGTETVPTTFAMEALPVRLKLSTLLRQT